MAITTRIFRSGSETETAELPKLPGGFAPDAIAWIDVSEPTGSDIAQVAELFGVPDFVEEDLLKGDQRPKIHVGDDFVFIVVYGMGIDSEIFREEVHIVLRQDAIATIRHSPAYGIEPVVSRIESVSDVFERGVALILYDILDEIVDGYFTTVDALEDQVDTTEQLVFSTDQSAADKEIQERVFAIRKQIVGFYQVSTAMRDVLNGILRHDVEVFPEQVHLYFLDIYDHLLRVNSSLELFRELVTGIFEAHLAVASNQMNKVMKKMTSWGAILLGAALIAGIYGMNFKEMPELRFLYGYPMALGMMAALTITLWIVFKKKNWL